MAITTLDGIVAGILQPVPIFKAIQAAKAAGRMTTLAGAAGMPGAYTLGTPGLNGATVDNTSAISGFLPFTDPVGEYAYLSKWNVQSAANIAQVVLYDLLWYNTGLVVTTTTGQAITFPTLPTRCPVGDGTFDANGLGCQAWLVCTGATGNAGAITNTTISYTDVANGSGRTGTIFPDWPISATIQHVSPFSLQAGDTGVKSIQSITLGTSYVSGTISLMVVRPIARLSLPSPTAPAGVNADPFLLGLPQLDAGSALYMAYVAGATAGGELYGELAFSHG